MLTVRQFISKCCYQNNLFNKVLVKNFAVSSSFNDKIVRSSYTDIEIPNVTVPEYLYSRIGKYSKLIASECGIYGRKYTYDHIRIKSKNLGKSLRKFFQLKKNDVIAIILPNFPEYPIAVLGCLDGGFIVTTVNPSYTPHEIARQLSDSSAKAVITLCDLHGTVKTAINIAKLKLPIIALRAKSTDELPDRAVDFMDLANMRADMPDVDISPDDIAFLPYSSGTTGLPKGVLLTHANMVANLEQTFIPELNVKIEATDSFQEVIPAILPMFHIYGLNSTVLGNLSTGSKIVTLPKFTPDLYISTLKIHKPTMLLVVPPLLLFLSASPEVKKEYFDSVRILLSGAAPLGALDEQRFLDKVGRPIPLLQGYGLTETSPTVAVTNPKFYSPGSIGSPIPKTEIKIVDINDTSQTLGPNKTGELLVKGPQVMQGYHNKPEETKDVFIDGWLRTGDIAYYNENNCIFITDRLKELIKVKGYQVPPAELEEVIRDFPSVAEAAVIGIPHELFGEVPRAFVVPKSGKNVDLKKLDEYVSCKVAPFKRLEGGIEVVDGIPKNVSGKILRRQIKLEYLDKFNTKQENYNS